MMVVLLSRLSIPLQEAFWDFNRDALEEWVKTVPTVISPSDGTQVSSLSSVTTCACLIKRIDSVTALVLYPTHIRPE